MAQKKFKGSVGAAGKNKRITVGENVTVSLEQERQLWEFIRDRLDMAKFFQDARVDRYRQIDKEISGYLRLDHDDKQREKDNRQGRGPKPTDLVLPLTFQQLDEAVTYFMSVIAPDSGIYEALASKDKQQVANAFAGVMNKHAKEFSHYRQIAKAIFDMMRYNFGGVLVEWQRKFGFRLATNNDGSVQTNYEVVREGNALTAIDPYNFYYDPSVDNPVNLQEEGEFFAVVDIVPEHKVRKMADDGLLFETKRFVEHVESHVVRYYKSKPEIFIDHSGENQQPDWHNILSMGSNVTESKGFEQIDCYVRLVPNKFGLSKSEKYEVWLLTFMANGHLVFAEHQNNAHNRLPISIGMPVEDGFGIKARSYGEQLLPLQRYASFQMNVKQRADRKALYGLTVYDKDAIPLGEEADLLGGTVGAKFTRQDKDIRRVIAQFNDVPDTQNVMQDISNVVDMMQRVLPTDILRQVANLERATTYQAAATVQGANRRNLKIAKVINDQFMENVRIMQMYNIFQFQEAMEMLDQNGELVEVNPSEFRSANIEFNISDGLRGIDKLIIVEHFRDVINMMLQSQIASQRIDVVEIINYWSSLLGEKVDFKQFKIDSPIDALPPEQKDLAFRLLQQFVQEQRPAQGAEPTAETAGLVRGAAGPNGGAPQ